METYQAIMTRRSVHRPDPGRVPSRETVEKLLAAAVRAPSHHLTQPWRFIVLAGDALRDFGEAWAAAAEREGNDPDLVRQKALRAPVIITVIEDPHLENPKVVEIEEHHAAGAAMQNILLAAHDLGLGAMLRTGPAAYKKEVRDYLKLTDDEIVAGFIYLGYPPENNDKPMTRRDEHGARTEWRGWE
jgi:nitroreductase